MSEEEEAKQPQDRDPFQRETICVANTIAVLRPSDPGFREQLSQTLVSAESRMLEEMIHLKQRLLKATTFDFWQILMEEITEITGCQYAFVAKRVLYDDERTAVEMPLYGDPGSCLMGLAFYYNNHKGQTGLFRDYKYNVYGCPCQWMRNDRVLLIPKGLAALTPNNPNAANFPEPAEGYLAVPLFQDGKCYAHFGCMWSAGGLEDRPKVSWGMLEMFLHSLEDLVGARIIEGLGLGDTPASDEKPEVIPQNMVVGSVATRSVDMRPSLRPYARRLSHELRTPMQGVVGMLDVMYANVIETITSFDWELPSTKPILDVCTGLKSNIEIAQDSSKRAIDAADNMVHAYDFDMEVPSTPSQSGASRIVEEEQDYSYTQDGSYKVDDLSNGRSNKRRRESRDSPGKGGPYKMPHIEDHYPLGQGQSNSGRQTPARRPSGSFNIGGFSAEPSSFAVEPRMADGYFSSPVPSTSVVGTPGGLSYDACGKLRLNCSVVRIRHLLREAVYYSLRSGGRPDYTKCIETPKGELLTVEMPKSRSQEKPNVINIETVVDEAVPEMANIDGQAMTKVISAVFHNAFKFTSSGRITLSTSVTDNRQILCSIIDTGEGIPKDFLPELFKPFTREDESLTRHQDGLGLGLMVAKSIARNMGGDLWCHRTATEGEHRGTEFRIRLPVTPADGFLSTPGTPSPLPTPAPETSLDPPERHHHSTDPPTITWSENEIPKKTASLRTLPHDTQLGKKVPLQILVVEDNKINRNLLCAMLKKLGYQNIREAWDGVEAVDQFSLTLDPSKEVIDLIFMDLWMPKMDGFEASERIVNLYREKNPDLESKKGPVILAVSADATDQARLRAVEKGIHGFIGKPHGLIELERAILRWFGNDTPDRNS
ncbi:hypothetical protein EDC01DRAFT_618621 [Geopyxis carbonaria]|nr:hypothetical protein EDC01DRAFT_618621 [Geopyxis carbonaria]